CLRYLCVLQCRYVWCFFLNCYYKLSLVCLKCLFLSSLFGFFIDMFVYYFFCCCCFFLSYYFCSIFSCLLGSCFRYLSDFSILFFIFPCYFCFGLGCAVCLLLFY